MAHMQRISPESLSSVIKKISHKVCTGDHPVQFQYSPYIFPLLVSTIIASFVAIYVWQRRATASGAMALALLALACAEWSLGYALEIAGADLPTKIFWGKSQYIGIATVPLLWVIFAYSYSTKGIQMTRRNVSLLSIVPLITLILAFTNEYHGLIWKDIQIHTVGTFSALEVTPGFWFWINWMFSNTLLLLGTIFILQSFNRTKGLFRRQKIILLVAVLTPWFGNVLYVSDLSLIPNLDITPFVFTISVIVFAWGIFSFKLVNLAPVARDLVVEKMPDGMIVLDAQGNIVDINPALQKALGLSASQAIGQRARDLFSAWPSLVERYANTLEAQDEIVLGEGESQRWYELRMSPLVGSRDRLLGRVVTVRNITEKKRTEEALRLSEEKYRKIYENVADVIYETDNQGHLTSISPSIEKQGGYLPEELIGRNVTEFFVFPEQYAALDALMIENGSVNDFEALLRQKDGNTRFASITSHIIFDANGQGVATEGVLRDITERKQAEENIRQMNVELERRVIERTSELEQALEKEQGMRNQLVQADKLAVLGKMVSVIAHEINNPIQTVKNTFYLLEDQIIPGSPAADYLKMASIEANRISDLIAQLRGIYASGSKTISRVNVLELLVEVHNLLIPQLKKNQVEWCQVDGLQLYTVSAVRNNLKQVFINLCLNAMEAMETDQGGRITVSLRPSQDGRRVGIDFHNTGPLISDQALPHIFDPFFTTKSNGTGLGLFISYDIIQQHQGEILVESAPGKGVMFTVWLPLAPGEEDRGAP
jgi:PAS domain S-box-containing protein